MIKYLNDTMAINANPHADPGQTEGEGPFPPLIMPAAATNRCTTMYPRIAPPCTRNRGASAKKKIRFILGNEQFVPLSPDSLNGVEPNVGIPSILSKMQAVLVMTKITTALKYADLSDLISGKHPTSTRLHVLRPSIP
jgi:hypothetical protein